MKLDLIKIGILTIHGYGFMIAIGVIAAYLTVNFRARRLNINSSYIDSLAGWILLGGALGSKLLYWLTQIENILQDPKILLNLTDGFVVYGGIIGGVLAGYLYCKKMKLQFFKYFDLIIPSVALAQGFGRIGCFMAGCCYGVETSSAFGVVFPMHSLAPDGIRVIPTQLISSGLDFLLYFILIFCAERKKTDGQIAALYLILYSVGRFTLEFFRGDLVRGNIGLFSTSQFISICILAVGIYILLSSDKKPNRRFAG